MRPVNRTHVVIAVVSVLIPIALLVGAAWLVPAPATESNFRQASTGR
jgi:hypothetical protein